MTHASSPRHSWFLPRPPRPRVTPDVPTEVIPFPSSRCDSTSTISSTSKFREHLDFDEPPVDSSTTPRNSPQIDVKVSSHSHFSPSTPAMEKGFQGTRPESLRERVGRALGWSEKDKDKDHDQCPCRNGHAKPTSLRGVWTGVLVALALLFLFGNVIFLDVRLTAVNNTTQQLLSTSRPERASAIVSPPPSASPSPTPGPAPPSNLASLPPPAASCISQFQSAPPSQADVAQFCARCVPALGTISSSWFVQQAHAGEPGRLLLQAVDGAAQACDDASAAMVVPSL